MGALSPLQVFQDFRVTEVETASRTRAFGQSSRVLCFCPLPDRLHLLSLGQGNPFALCSQLIYKPALVREVTLPEHSSLSEEPDLRNLDSSRKPYEAGEHKFRAHRSWSNSNRDVATIN